MSGDYLPPRPLAETHRVSVDDHCGVSLKVLDEKRSKDVEHSMTPAEARELARQLEVAAAEHDADDDLDTPLEEIVEVSPVDLGEEGSYVRLTVSGNTAGKADWLLSPYEARELAAMLLEQYEPEEAAPVGRVPSRGRITVIGDARGPSAGEPGGFASGWTFQDVPGAALDFPNDSSPLIAGWTLAELESVAAARTNWGERAALEIAEAIRQHAAERAPGSCTVDGCSFFGVKS